MGQDHPYPFTHLCTIFPQSTLQELQPLQCRGIPVQHTWPSLLPQLGDPQISAGKAQSSTTAWHGRGPSPELRSPFLPRLWAGDRSPAVASGAPAPGISARLAVGITCALHHILSALWERGSSARENREGRRAGGTASGLGEGCGTPCIKRSESTIFHCWRSQPRHQLLGESSLKSLLILFLPLHFFSPFLAGVLDKASLPPLLPLPQPTQEALEPKEGLKPGAGGKELHVCALVNAWACLGGWEAPLRFPASLRVHLEVCIL